MANLAKIVDYEVTAPVIIHEDKEQGNVTFHVRSLENPQSAEIMRRRQAAAMGRKAIAKGQSSDEEIGAILLDMFDPDPELLAPCIVSWEWSGHSFEDGEVNLGSDPSLTIENSRHVLNVPWIRTVVSAGVRSIKVFPKA